MSTILLSYCDVICDDRHVRIEAEYVPAQRAWSGGTAESDEAGITRVYDVAELAELAKQQPCFDMTQAEIREELRERYPREWARLREECLARCLGQMELERLEERACGQRSGSGAHGYQGGAGVTGPTLRLVDRGRPRQLSGVEIHALVRDRVEDWKALDRFVQRAKEARADEVTPSTESSSDRKAPEPAGVTWPAFVTLLHDLAHGAAMASVLVLLYVTAFYVGRAVQEWWASVTIHWWVLAGLSACVTVGLGMAILALARVREVAGRVQPGRRVRRVSE